MNGIAPVISTHQAASPQKSSPRAADQTAANAAHAARSGAIARLSAARGRADTGAILTAEQALSAATAAVRAADAWVKSDCGLNLMA